MTEYAVGTLVRVLHGRHAGETAVVRSELVAFRPALGYRMETRAGELVHELSIKSALPGSIVAVPPSWLEPASCATRLEEGATAAIEALRRTEASDG